MLRSMLIWVVCYWYLSTALVEGSYSYPQYPGSEPKFNYPLNRKQPYSFLTPAPVAFISSAAVPITLPPVRITVWDNDLLLVKNEGDDVEIVPYDNRCIVATLTGGPVYNERYRFWNVDYACDGVPNNTRSTDSMDGQSLPVQFVILFYNERYGSFNNSLKHRDGIVSLAIPVVVCGNIPNPGFVSLQNALYKIQKPETVAAIRAKEVLYWLLKTLTTGTPYYSYPGAFRGPSGAASYCTVDIHPNFDARPWISYSQYKTFTLIRNGFGDPLVSTSPVFPLDSRPFVECCSPIYVYYV